MKKNLGRIAVGMGAAAAAITLAAGPASAEDATVYSYTTEWTGNIIHYASLKFTAYGDKWTVCDLNSDGRRAMGSVYWSDSAGNHILKTSVTTGENTCNSDSHDFAESEKLTLQVWRQNGASGDPEDRYTTTVSASN
ncbi:hypothetical protein ACWGNN_14100 [Streptomyces sp. NPDC055817]